MFRDRLGLEDLEEGIDEEGREIERDSSCHSSLDGEGCLGLSGAELLLGQLWGLESAKHCDYGLLWVRENRVDAMRR